MKGYIHNIFRLLILFLFPILGYGCKEDFNSDDAMPLPGKGEVVINLNISNPRIVLTRDIEADEKRIDDIVMLIFSSENGTLLQKEILRPGDGRLAANGDQYKINMKLSWEVSGDVKTFFIANGSSLLSDFSGSLSDFMAITDNSVNNATRNFIMYAYYFGDLEGKNLSLKMNRISAKFRCFKSVSLPSTGGNQNGYPAGEYDYGAFSNSTIEGFAIRCSTKGYVFPEETETDPYSPKFRYIADSYSIDNWNNVDFADKDSFVYGYPTQTKSSSESAECYVIVKVNFKERRDDEPVVCYYRIDFIDYNENYEKTLIPVNPNHYYNIYITGIYMPGYSTPEEAARHPMEKLIEGYVETHPPMITSITTDGCNELGVNDNLIYDTYGDDNWAYMCCYSPDSDMYVNDARGNEIPLNLKVEVIEGSSWLSVEMSSLQECDESEYGPTFQDKWGLGIRNRRVWKVKLKANNPQSGNTGKINVEWANLRRDIIVTY